LLFNAGQPLIVSSNDISTKPSPIYLSTADVQQFLGPSPYFGQGKEPGELVVERDGESHDHAQHFPTEAARHLGIPVVFLGLHETQAEDSSTVLLTSDFRDPETAIKKLNGIPYFAMDVVDLEYTQGMLEGMLKETTPGREGKSLAWSEPRALMSTLDAFTAAIFALARSILDWNQRNKVGVSY
jgi:NAD+ diphosphatase